MGDFVKLSEKFRQMADKKRSNVFSSFAVLWLFMVAVLLLGPQSKAHAASNCGVAANPIVNCGFETGDFTGWVKIDINGSTSYVSNNEWPSAIEGVYSAYHNFDGNGPDTIEIAQDVALPVGSTELTFGWSAYWEIFGGLGRTFTVTIQPAGGGEALQSTLILATDGAPFGNFENMTGTVDVSAFAGQTVRISFDWFIPERFTGPGHFQLDNIAVHSGPAAKPDLAILSLNFPLTAGEGDTVEVTDTLRNSGTGNAGASTITYYLSTNGTVGNAVALLGNRTVGSLAAGADNSATTALTVPEGTPAGTYYIVALADADGEVAEVYENNNVTFKMLRVGPDLTVSSLIAPNSAVRGTAINITASIMNSLGTAGASTARYYLSTNGTVANAVAILGSRAVGPLAAGAKSTATTSVTIPAGIAIGTYYVIVAADVTNAVTEIYEANNIRFRSIKIN